VDDILGVNPNRPAPEAPRRIATDYNEWHINLVMADYFDELERRQRAVGEATVPRACRSMRRTKPEALPPVAPTVLSAALEEGRELLVQSRVVTRPVAAMLSARDVRTLLADLKRRIETRQKMGIVAGDADE